MLRRIFGTERGDVTGEWTELSNKERNDLYCPPHNVLPGDRIEIHEIDWACDL